MTLVLDSSVTVNWVLNDETTQAVEALFEEIGAYGAIVPSLWRLEVANSLSVAVYRKRLDMTYRDKILQHLDAMPITIDAHTCTHAWAETLELADQFRLTLYDASYLELALRRRLPLATLDTDLRSAAKKLKIKVLGS